MTLLFYLTLAVLCRDTLVSFSCKIRVIQQRTPCWVWFGTHHFSCKTCKHPITRYLAMLIGLDMKKIFSDDSWMANLKDFELEKLFIDLCIEQANSQGKKGDS